MSSRPSEVLKHSTQEILSLWETEVRSRIPAAEFESRRTLRNSIPEFLADLILAFETGFAEQSSDFLRFAHKHGSERANASHYSIEDAITEYNILRRIIFNVLERKCDVVPRDRDIIYEAISLGLAKAGAEFARTQIREVQGLNTRLNLALEAASIGMYSLDVRTGIVHWNEHLARVFGFDPSVESINVEEAQKLYHPDDYQRVVDSIGKMAESGGIFHERYRIIRKDGTVRWLESVGRAVKDEEGNVTHMIGTNIDITESKLSRDTIRNLAERLQLITDIQPTLVIYLDPQMNYQFVNETYRQWFNRDPSIIIGKNQKDFFPKEDWEALQEKSAPAWEGKTVRFKLYVHYPTGLKYVDIIYRPHFNDDGKIIGMFVSASDRTEEKTIIDELRREQDLRDKFVSTLSHDLRTPLTASKMSAQIIARKISDPNIHTHTTRIVENINRADKLIQDLLDAGKIRAGKLALPVTEEFDLIQLIRSTLEDLTTIHGDRFRLSSPPELKVNLHAEGVRRILENLCTNAIKYGSAQEPVRVLVVKNDHHIELSVANAVNPQINIDKEKLFEPFERGDQEGRKSGWGIGLTIVKGLAEIHGGKVDVSTDHDTIFTVTLPLDARPFLTQHLH